VVDDEALPLEGPDERAGDRRVVLHHQQPGHIAKCTGRLHRQTGGLPDSRLHKP
jgi:hypothetical protein